MTILFLIIWIILNGSITSEILIFGIVISLLLYIFLCRVFSYSWRRERWLLLHLPLIILYILNLILEILKSSTSVAAIILRGQGANAVFYEFRSGLEDRLLNTILANSITLTPGTYTVALEGDHFLISCLRPEYAEGLEDSSFIRLLRRLQ
ncbi:MAG: Na+/H+ antiporter subunit E [Lachnospiraceae bacterium]|nr:Na+/H+ antiporter subunit E [Lachnospiraceae bacterium]